MLELDSELALEELTELLEEELDELDCELDELDKSSIEEIHNRKSVLDCGQPGPGNCNDPVWKFKMAGADTSPVVLVSMRTACHMVLSGNV